MTNNNNAISYKIPLIIVSIFLAISLTGNAYLYTQQYGITSNGGSEGQIADLENQIATLQNEKSTLQNEIDNLKASNLVTRLGATDEKPWLQTDYLHVSGSVWNVGTNTAHNCRLHIILYQGQTVAKDTYINLGTINGKGYVDVNEKVYYEGSALTDWSITPEWE